MNKKTEEFMSRLKEFARYNGLSIAQLQNRIGKTNSYFRNTYDQSGYIRREIWEKIREEIDPLVNEKWIERGEGEMHLMTPTEVKANTVLLLPIKAQGGSLNDFEVQVAKYECERIISPIKEAELAIPIAGDSMSPEYPNGCRVFIKKIDEKAFINWGNTFVLDTVNGVIIKNVYPCKDDDEKVICHSVNPNYPDFEVYKKDVLGWYSVLAMIALK